MSQELENRIVALSQAIGDDIQALQVADGDLSTLTTSNKTNLVAAINEVLAAVAGAGGGDMLKSENLSGLADYVVARANLDVRSTAQVASDIASAVTTITLGGLGGLTEAEVDARANAALAISIGSAPAAFDTIQEIAAELAADDSAFSALVTTVSNKVAYNVAQTLTTGEKLQACQNIGVGNPDRDFLLEYTTARDS